MLITLQSESGGDASTFSNYFRETVQIQPNSEIALVSIAYKFSNDDSSDRESQVMLVNLEDFQLKSICKTGGVQSNLAMIPYGALHQDATKAKGEFFYEAYNLIYHKLDNADIVNHNQLRIRITDGVGNALTKLEFPTTITVDLRPRAR